MKRNLRMYSKIFLCTLIGMSSCKKNDNSPEQIAVAPIIPITPPTSTTPTAVIPAYEVGTGSGNLTIDGASLDFTRIKLVRIKAGTYKTIYIKNLSGTLDAPINIKNNGQVVITDGLETDNIINVSISGDNDIGIKYGFSFENIPFRAIKMNKRIFGVTLKSLSFRNVADYCIAGERSNGDLAYDGGENTRNERFKVINCLFDNTGAIVFNGSLNKDNSQDMGLFKDVEIAYNQFQNTNAGALCVFGNIQDYNVHHNVVNNVNMSNNNHNGVFYMQGNGTFHHNKLTNYQGNAIRMWVYSRGSSPVTVEIYDNICYNTRKYGGFEIQGFDRNIYPGKTTYVNAKVYNNTVGRMNTSKDWEGEILDLYNYGGTLQYYNNLGFELYHNGLPIANMINNMSDTKITLEQNNKYVASQQDAVTDLESFLSKITGIGALL
ncbi:hypothetical protein [Pedobacter sp. Leaf194]|uniref:hypothetical protein n=1 Tax=Pedobacter sp. Leaf194 TaxID=1736297 RepID=UPI00070368E5|nr:hypothetical protein [Pedobacter sp. Leaf194]KQS32307.1 hypothetical protein ASG14_17355 [Pedobacter sp. Leaf194]